MDRQDFHISLARLKRLYRAKDRWANDPEMRRLFGRLTVAVIRGNYWERRARVAEAELHKLRKEQE